MLPTQYLDQPAEKEFTTGNTSKSSPCARCSLRLCIHQFISFSHSAYGVTLDIFLLYRWGTLGTDRLSDQNIQQPTNRTENNTLQDSHFNLYIVWSVLWPHLVLCVIFSLQFVSAFIQVVCSVKNIIFTSCGPPHCLVYKTLLKRWARQKWWLTIWVPKPPLDI